jgi:hypothetical protein
MVATGTIGPGVSLQPLQSCVSIYRLRSESDRYPCLSRLNFRSFRLQTPSYHFSGVALARYFIATDCRVYPTGWPVWPRDLPVARSRVRQLLAGSPTGLAESSSLVLRTDLSPQVALHLSSRKRSYHCWIQGGNVTLDRTCTHLFKRLHRRTSRTR